MRPVRIQLLKSLLIGSHTHAAGDVVEVHPAKAAFFIQAELATRYLPEAPVEVEGEGEGEGEGPTAPTGFATASRKAGRRRASTLIGENAGA